MSAHPTNFQGDVCEAIKAAIEEALPGVTAQVTGRGGHFSIDAVGPVFAGQSMLQSQRLVYKAIAHLMAGDLAPVHAVDSLTTRAS